MELKNLLGTPNNELTVDELQDKIRLLRKLKLTAIKTKPGKPKTNKSKSNKDKQLDNLLDGLSEEQLKLLKNLL